MHAVLVRLTFEDQAAARAELSEVVRRAAGAPGFVAGYPVARPDEVLELLLARPDIPSPVAGHVN